MTNPTLTADAAIELLAEGDMVHTYRSSSIGPIGADWKRGKLIEAIKASHRLEIGGGACLAMGHGLVVWTESDRPLFVQTKVEGLPDEDETPADPQETKT